MAEAVVPTIDEIAAFAWRHGLTKLSPEDRVLLEREGRLVRPSQYSPEPSVFTWKLIEEGRNHLVLDKTLALPCPVRLLHGQDDPDVPWEYSLQIARHVDAPEVITTTSFPARCCWAICATSWPICSKSGCLRESVSTPVPSFTTILPTFFNNSRRMARK